MSLPDDLFGPEEPEEPKEPSWFSRLFSSVPVWISIWAVVVAVVCFVLALQARNEIHYAQRRIDDTVRTINESRQTIEAFQSQIRLLEERLDQQQRLFSGRLTETRNMTQALEASIRQNNERMDGLEGFIREGFEEVARRMASPGQPAPEVSPATGELLVDDDPEVDPLPATRDGEDREDMQTYVVQPGDHMTRIARRFNIRLDRLIDANPDINPDVLRVGQVLRIPAQDD